MNAYQNADYHFDDDNEEIADEMVEGTIAIDSYHPVYVNTL